jgi:hypothetical protein
VPRQMTAVEGEVCRPWPGFRDGVAGITHLQPPWGGRIDGLAAAWDNHGVRSGCGPGDVVVISTIRWESRGEKFAEALGFHGTRVFLYLA